MLVYSFVFVSTSLLSVAAVNSNQFYGFKAQRPTPTPTLLSAEGFNNYRIFHPAFPTQIRIPLSYEDASNLSKIKETLSSDSEAQAATSIVAAKLPWKVLPTIGVREGQNYYSKSQIEEQYASNRHHGSILWAYKAQKVEPGVVLLNNWSQQAILISSYSLERGAEGTELLTSASVQPKSFRWPSLALDFEISDNKWQVVRLAPKYFEAVGYLQGFPKGAWELAFLLLLTEENGDALQALFDTGLCPQQGFIAYIRVLEQIKQRTEQWEDVPPHRKITEREILKQ